MSDTKLQHGGEYEIAPGEDVWITLGLASLRVYHSADGVIATLYRKGAEDCGEVSEIATVWGDLGGEDAD